MTSLGYIEDRYWKRHMNGKHSDGLARACTLCLPVAYRRASCKHRRQDETEPYQSQWTVAVFCYTSLSLYIYIAWLYFPVSLSMLSAALHFILTCLCGCSGGKFVIVLLLASLLCFLICFVCIGLGYTSEYLVSAQCFNFLFSVGSQFPLFSISRFL